MHAVQSLPLLESQEKMRSNEEKAREYFSKLSFDPIRNSSYYYEDSSGIIASSYSNCLAPLRGFTKREEGTCLIIGFFESKENREFFLEYWEWLSDKEKSPWRSVFHSGFPEIVKNKKDEIVGLLVPYYIFKDLESGVIESNTLLSFLVATRAVTEFVNHIRFWSYCVKNGVEPCLAFFLSTYFVYRENKIQRTTVANSNHWVITTSIQKDSKNSNFSLKRFQTSLLSIGGCMSHKFVVENYSYKGQDIAFNYFNQIGVLENTTFSRVKKVNLDMILEAYEKIKKYVE